MTHFVGRAVLILFAALAGQLALSSILARPASATLDACVVVISTSDGFLSLRTGPGVRFPEVMRIRSGTIIAIESPPQDPTGRWVHVSGVVAGGRIVATRGWANQRYLRPADCPG
jgi:uncharacterized protein YraI